MGCNCGKSFTQRTVSSRATPNSRSTVPPQVQNGTFVGRTVRSQVTPYGMGKPNTVVRRSV